mgnify:CR=1 FL=1
MVSGLVFVYCVVPVVSLFLVVFVLASRKSMIDKISPSSPNERLAGTITLHVEAVKNGADILRVHDVYEHVQAVKVLEALDTI